MENITGGFLAGIQTTLAFFWDSLFGLIFGFLISAIVQTVATPRQMERWLGPNIRGVLWGAGFGIVSSACSYGAAAAARGFYERGADIRAIFSFMISSTNMNVAILVLFWALLGWKFVFAEFFGGAIIIAVVVAGFSLLFSSDELKRMQQEAPGGSALGECPICGMEGEAAHAVSLAGVTYFACGPNHEKALRDGALDARNNRLSDPATWRVIWQTFLGDVAMLRNELIIGYVIAGFAAALVPAQWLTGALGAVGHLPLIGYPLLLLTGLLLAVLTFVCSMGNVPVARFLALAGIPLGANVTFIYGDLLVLPLIGIYRKSFAPRIVWAFLGLFVVGAMLAGVVMELTLGHGFGGVAAMGSMQFNQRFTLVTNIAGILAVLAVWLNYKANASLKAAD
jgi:uncharacterized membrane protein YraQ (UPF0718 family)